MYLFDTDIITNLFKPRPSKLLLDRLQDLPQQNQYISSITVSEIVYGAMKSKRPRYHLNNLESVLLPAINIAVFDTKAAYVCGELRARLEQQGRCLDLADLEIASVAISRGLVLVSGNTKHFKGIEELQLENWLC